MDFNFTSFVDKIIAEEDLPRFYNVLAGKISMQKENNKETFDCFIQNIEDFQLNCQFINEIKTKALL